MPKESVKCPKCHGDDVIMEQPSHGLREEKDIHIDCYCVPCNIFFDVTANLCDLEYSDLRDAENGYPYSA